MTSPSKLILLPCHSIWKFYGSTNLSNPGHDQAEWSLLSFQKESNDQLIFIKHLEASVSILDKEKDSILVISGGCTKSDTGPVSEAQSYYYLGLLRGLINEQNKARVVLENYARDSMENLMFSLMRFHSVFNTFPQEIDIVGFEFKRSRFLSNHCKALALSNVKYIGFNPILLGESEEANSKFLKDTEELEYKFAVRHFETDPFGVKAPLLSKKLTRDPFKSGGEHNYVSFAKDVTPNELESDKFLSKFYLTQEIYDNLDFFAIYKFITSH